MQRSSGSVGSEHCRTGSGYPPKHMKPAARPFPSRRMDDRSRMSANSPQNKKDPIITEQYFKNQYPHFHLIIFVRVMSLLNLKYPPHFNHPGTFLFNLCHSAVLPTTCFPDRRAIFMTYCICSSLSHTAAFLPPSQTAQF